MFRDNWLRRCDRGMRRGTHILTALALGARARSAGRLGTPTVREVDASLIRKVGASWG